MDPTPDRIAPGSTAADRPAAARAGADRLGADGPAPAGASAPSSRGVDERLEAVLNEGHDPAYSARLIADVACMPLDVYLSNRFGAEGMFEACRRAVLGPDAPAPEPSDAIPVLSVANVAAALTRTIADAARPERPRVREEVIRSPAAAALGSAALTYRDLLRHGWGAVLRCRSPEGAGHLILPDYDDALKRTAPMACGRRDAETVLRFFGLLEEDFFRGVGEICLRSGDGLRSPRLPKPLPAPALVGELGFPEGADSSGPMDCTRFVREFVLVIGVLRLSGALEGYLAGLPAPAPQTALDAWLERGSALDPEDGDVPGDRAA